MRPNISKTPLLFCYVASTCQILFRCIFQQIERRSLVKTASSVRLMRSEIERKRSKYFYKELECMSDINESGGPTHLSCE